MCGRYTQTTKLEKVVERFKVKKHASVKMLPARFNLAPGQDAPVVIAVRDRMLKQMRWGLVPGWTREPSPKYRMINARAETLTEKPSYRTLLRHKRCLVPADGFFEWYSLKGQSRKQPRYFFMRDHRPFAFAGLWDDWLGPDGSELFTFTIVTTEANERLRPYHDRMPVILTPETEQAWLDPDIGRPADLLPLLRPCDPLAMDDYPVSTRINRTVEDDEGLIQEVELPTPKPPFEHPEFDW